MDYIIAKKLKDSGFQFRQLTQTQEGFMFGDNIQYLQPTLSELIKACGENWGNLQKVEGGYVSCVNERLGQTSGLCKSSEEAVAKLWLALKDKI